MKGEIHNLRRRLDARGVWVVLPAILAIVGAAGITTPNAVELTSLRANAERAEGEAGTREQLSESVAAFERAGGEPLARAGIERASSVLPANCSTVEVHSAVRLAAREASWKLTLLNVAEPVEVEGFDAVGGLARRSIELSGSATFSGMSRLVRSLAAHGYPTRVVNLSLVRENATSAQFEIRAVLALFHGDTASANETDALEEH